MKYFLVEINALIKKLRQKYDFYIMKYWNKNFSVRVEILIMSDFFTCKMEEEGGGRLKN